MRARFLVWAGIVAVVVLLWPLHLALSRTVKRTTLRAPTGATEVQSFKPLLRAASSKNSLSTRLMVATRGPVTEAMLQTLRAWGTVHGVIRRYNIVALTPRGPHARMAIERLEFVRAVETDQPRYLTDFGTWDRDLLDVTDVQEDGAVGDPDPREVAQTGAGVTVAVIDTGLIQNWRTFFVASRVNTALARAFMGGGAVGDDFVPPDEFNISNPTNLWERDTNSHGTAVASHIIGFKIGGLVADGVAPGAQVLPLKVFPNGEAFTFSSRIIGALAYLTDLKVSGLIGPTVANISIGGGPSVLERIAIQDAMANGIVIVASAGNEGEAGMAWPAAYPEMISAGAVGWTLQFQPGPPAAPNGAFWRTRDVTNDPDGSGTSEELQAFVADFSSRAIPDLGSKFGVDPQQLDVLAPGLWTVAPGAHGPQAAYFYWAGTSFSSPLVAGIAALILEKNPTLAQSDVETILKASALPMAAVDSRAGVLEPFEFGLPVIHSPSWDTDCNGSFCDPVGAGLVQADAALAATPAP